jgi:hypothetical protein
MLVSREQLRAGFTCPHCGRYGQEYKRKLNSGMAASLIWLVKFYESRKPLGVDFWVNVQENGTRQVLTSREIGKLQYWGLAELKPNLDEPDKKESGLWRPTGKGIDFVYNRTRVPSHVFVYDDKVLEFSTETVNVQDALGTKFSYADLMKGV